MPQEKDNPVLCVDFLKKILEQLSNTESSIENSNELTAIKLLQPLLDSLKVKEQEILIEEEKKEKLEFEELEKEKDNQVIPEQLNLNMIQIEEEK